jgi:hypothetical protein
MHRQARFGGNNWDTRVKDPTLEFPLVPFCSLNRFVIVSSLPHAYNFLFKDSSLTDLRAI